MGRLLKGAVHGQKAGTYHVLVGYGWANSDTNKEKAWRTNNLVTAALLEEKDLCQTPTFFVGDLNANIETLPALVDALQNGGWVDIAAIDYLQKLWNNQNHGHSLVPSGCPAANCWAHGAKKNQTDVPMFLRTTKRLK